MLIEEIDQMPENLLRMDLQGEYSESLKFVLRKNLEYIIKMNTN
jgi:hypothetical protein